tara:strand:- start:164 stop:343 length:180 start_codon:yes stop_codon:yes gene_type:complete
MTIQLIQRAILNNKETFRGVKLPTRQTSGTDRQIVSYAYIQAQEFYANNMDLTEYLYED